MPKGQSKIDNPEKLVT